MKIAVDIDGPVAKFAEAYIKYCNVRFGLDMALDCHTRWQLYECDTPLTKEQDALAFQSFCNIRMFAALELEIGAKEGLCTLSSMGCDIIYITARPHSAHRTTAKWIVKQGLPLDGLLFVENNKGEMAKLLGCELAIDDKIENCEDFLKNGINTIIWSKLYNIELQEQTNLTRLANWKEVVKYVSLKKELV